MYFLSFICLFFLSFSLSHSLSLSPFLSFVSIYNNNEVNMTQEIIENKKIIEENSEPIELFKI